MTENATRASEFISALPGRPTVVLIGAPGAGKSTIGRRLARALNMPLTDSDALIEAAENATCGEVFSRLGEAAFREKEAIHVAEALEHQGVVSLGGGAVLHPDSRARLRSHVVVWVDVSAAEGARRTAAENTRPVLAAADPKAHYRDLLEQRAPYYREVATYRVRTDGRTPAQLVAEILGLMDNLD